MNCKPIGRPLDCPQGTEIPGKPAKLTGVVNKSLAYIVNGSSISSPILNAVVGVVGPTTTSYSSNTLSKSFLINVLTFETFYRMHHNNQSLMRRYQGKYDV